MGILIMNFMFIGELLVPSFRNYLVFANKTSKLEKFVALSQYACVCLNMHVLVCSCRVIFGRRGNLMSTSIYAGYTYHLIASIHMNFLLPKLWLTESYFLVNMTSLTIDALEIWLCEEHYTHSLGDGRDCTWAQPREVAGWCFGLACVEASPKPIQWHILLSDWPQGRTSYPGTKGRPPYFSSVANCQLLSTKVN